MPQRSHSAKRRRGVILSSQGWQRLQTAEHLSSIRHNQGKPYTLEQITEITAISKNTLTKVHRRQNPVDWQTLQDYFASFGLTINSDDILDPNNNCTGNDFTLFQQLPFTGPLTLNSAFYIYRGSERLCREAILKPGTLLRIEGPRQFGKTSLMAHSLAAARDRNFRTSVVNLKGVERQILEDIDRFLQWFCAVVAKDLGMPNELSQRWDPLFGSSYSCSEYFETYLLPAAESPLLLVFDGLDTLFDYPQLASDFLGMLRSWYEQGQYGLEEYTIWQRLRLVLIHSTEERFSLNINQSPFNVGLLVKLTAFTCKQVEELSHRYGIEQPQKCAQEIFSLVGGDPYLTQLSLFHLSQGNIDLAELSKQAAAPDGIFSDRLRQQLERLQRKPSLLDTMKTVAQHPEGIELSSQNASRLEGMGLIQFKNKLAIPSCQLYQNYFGTLDN